MDSAIKILIIILIISILGLIFSFYYFQTHKIRFSGLFKQNVFFGGNKSERSVVLGEYIIGEENIIEPFTDDNTLPLFIENRKHAKILASIPDPNELINNRVFDPMPNGIRY